MKELTLIRHAKSSWETGVDDHNRPLNSRGHNDAPRIGDALVQLEPKFEPEAFHSSTAIRAFTTAKIIADKIGFELSAIETFDELYLPSTQNLVRHVQQLDENLDSVVMFGHNPGFEMLAEYLLGPKSIGPMVTCAVVRMQLKIDYWANVDAACADLIEHLVPRNL